jgi:ferredoxin
VRSQPQAHLFVVSSLRRCDMTVRIAIDPILCDAYGYCAELLPEAIVLDEWGYPIIDGRPLPTELESVAARAVRDCPRRAIALVRTADAD